ncbi:DUF5994 family protein [Streptomyces sp. HUAS TT7]|uniref:DUF5994 family protein n=1 Tax=Streptomyces sp. HUAS TT7 TaxID=3447507 RepID=UPI003F65815E
MTTTLDRLTTTRPLSATSAGTSPPQARLALTPADRTLGPLDDAWWPCMRDLSLELPPLAAALDEGETERTRDGGHCLALAPAVHVPKAADPAARCAP